MYNYNLDLFYTSIPKFTLILKGREQKETKKNGERILRQKE
jgi:hypothetical protein